jgi:hypothetical protein
MKEFLKKWLPIGNHERPFCLFPFVSTRYSPDGSTAICSEGLKEIGPAERFDSNTFDEVWNSEFMRDFRMKMINNTYVENCYSCYYGEAHKYETKRENYLTKNYEEYKHVVEDAFENNGYISTVPWHWEVRLSNLCNAQCVSCRPINSSKIASEIHNNLDNELLPVDIKNDYTIYKETYERKAKHADFINNIWENIEHIRLLELHGGEPWAEPMVIKLLDDISKTEYAKQIEIKTFSNCSLLTLDKIEVLDKFKGGTFICSIDGVGTQAEYVRYPLNWNEVTQGVKLVLDNLNSNWKVRTLTVSSILNIYNIDSIFDFLLETSKQTGSIKNNTDDRLLLIHAPVNRPRFLSYDLLPYEMRLGIAEKLERFKGIEQMVGLAEEIMNHLRTTDKVLAKREGKSYKEYLEFRDIQLKKFKSYYIYLDNVRHTNTLELFPHLKLI